MGQVADELRRRRAAGGDRDSVAQSSPVLQELRARRPEKAPPKAPEASAAERTPTTEPTFSQKYVRPAVTGAIEFAGAYNPAYLATRGAAALTDYAAGQSMRSPSIADVMRGSDDPEAVRRDAEARERVASELGGIVGGVVESPLTALRGLEDIALGPAIDESTDPQGRFERYAGTAGQTLGGGLGMGSKLFSLFSLSGTASGVVEESLRQAGVDPEVAKTAGTGTLLGLGAVDLAKGVGRFIRDKTLSPARRIAALLGEGEMDIVSFAEQEAARRGIPFEQARREIEQASLYALHRLGSDYVPVFEKTAELLTTAERNMTYGTQAHKKVADAVSIINKGRQAAVQTAVNELQETLQVTAKGSQGVGKRLQAILKDLARKVREPITAGYKGWDALYGNRGIPVSPADLLEIQQAMDAAKGAVQAQQGAPRSAGDVIYQQRLQNILAELGTLQGHLVDASAAKIRNSITALKTRLREVGFGDAAGMYRKPLELWENLLNSGLQNAGEFQAIEELAALDAEWRQYADRFYSRTVRNFIDADAAMLPKLTQNSVTVGPATEIRAALGDKQVDDWTNYALERMRKTNPEELIEVQQYIYGDSTEAAKAGELLRVAHDSVNSKALIQARSNILRAMQTANPTQREYLQSVLAGLDENIEMLSVLTSDRGSVDRIKRAVEADRQLIESDWARVIRDQIKTSDEISQQMRLVRQAEAVSPEAGQVARRAILEKYLLPNGENTTARQIAEQFRKKRPQITRIIGETELSEADLHELFKQLERLAEKLGKPSWLNAKAPLLSELFESLRFTKPSPPPQR
jgi:hypothetical protein